MFPRNVLAVLRRIALLLSVCVLAAALSCDVFEGSPDASAPKGFDDPDELMQACAEKEQEIFQWGEDKAEDLFWDLMTGSEDLRELEDDAERLQGKVDDAMQELSNNCRAEAEKLRAAARKSVESTRAAYRRGDYQPLPTAKATRARRVAAAPAFTPSRPTRTPVPTPRPTPTTTSTSIPTPAPVPGGIPLVAAFLDVPPSHNGDDAVQFGLRFSEPVSLSYKTLRDAAIQAVNGTVRESKRVDKRNDLWMVTVEPEGAEDMVITLTAPADCDDAASVCTEGEKLLANSPVVRVPHGD